MSGKMISLKIQDDLLDRIDKKSSEQGKSRSQFIIDSLEVTENFDRRFLLGINGVSKELGMNPSDLIQSIMCRWMAKYDAQTDLIGTYIDLPTDTATQGDFEADFLMFRSEEIKKIEKRSLEHAIEIENCGGELEEYQKEILIKYRIGKAWLESEQYKKEKEMQEIYEKYKDHSKFIAGWADDEDKMLEELNKHREEVEGKK